MQYHCRDEHRSEAVRQTDTHNGIEFLEVVDADAVNEEDRQRLLRVTFLKTPHPALDGITIHDVHIDGGTRIVGIKVVEVGFDVQDPDVLIVRVNTPGDYSVYTLRLAGAISEHLDQMLSTVDFSFKIECPTEFDCVDDRTCPPDVLEEPAIDYLARDYASFRQLMLDRLSMLAPDWRERSPADVGVAIVELLAYRADHLSYQLDAIGMESTLPAARRRSSVRRHARLVDYAMHDGANARTWVHIEVSAGTLEIPAGTPLFTQVPRANSWIAPGSTEERRALESRPIVFETMHAASLHNDLNCLRLHTWGNRECCLPRGATSATLRGHHDFLDRDMVLVFRERIGPTSGKEVDADPAKRHAVRLTGVRRTVDMIGVWFEDPLSNNLELPVTEISWAEEDALPFAVCVSATSLDGEYHGDVSVALGNIVLADHGQTISRPLAKAPRSAPWLEMVAAGSGTDCDAPKKIAAPPRYTPLLTEAPLTMAGTTGRLYPGSDERRWEGFDPSKPASSAFQWEQRHVLPQIFLDEPAEGRRWFPRRDLLASDGFSPEFVAEIEPDGHARLRFGDDEFGLRPAAGASFQAVYRVGNGPEGNIGADALGHILINDPRITNVANPMPARGGAAPESMEHVRREAPSAFWTQQRAVTPEDYAEVAQRHWQVQRAVATERWTGSWHTIFLTIDRFGALPVDTLFEDEVRVHLERFRMAGHDIEIDGPSFVWLEVELRVCVLPEFYRGDVKKALLDVFQSGNRPDGSRGFFHPDNFTFNQPVYLSPIIAAAQETPGVRLVEAQIFERFGDPQTSALDTGVLPIGRLEIARLDNDPSFPERGVLRLNMEGGR